MSRQMSDVLLITGAAGFIGRHLCAELLKCDHEIIAVDIDAQRLDALRIDDHGRQYGARLDDHGTKRHVDIRSAEDMAALAKSLRTVRIPTLIHLAAIAAPRIAEKHPDIAWATNVQGTYNVLRLAQTVGVRRVLFFSTAHVYGISPKYFPTDEWHPLALQDTYTSTKIAGEALCDLFFRNYGIAYTTLRLFNGYGPGQSADYFIGAKIRQARAATGYGCQFEAGARIALGASYRGVTPFTMPAWHEVTKDWVHVSDIVDAAVRALDTDFVGPINIGTGYETSLGWIVRTISEAFSVPHVPEETKFDGGPTRMRCDRSRAESILRWAPRVKFADGLHQLLRESE
jgi:UDP-glucose 4-epimerase